VLEVEQFYNEIRRPVYNKRNDIIHNIPDFWLTAVSSLSLHLLPTFRKLTFFLTLLCNSFGESRVKCCGNKFGAICCLQFLSHPVLCDLLTDDDQKVSFYIGNPFACILWLLGLVIFLASFSIQTKGKGFINFLIKFICLCARCSSIWSR
jgi:hypothetical protein